MKETNIEVILETSNGDEAIKSFINHTLKIPMCNMKGMYQVSKEPETFSIQHPVLEFKDDVNNCSIELTYMIAPPKNRAVHTLTPDEAFKNRIYFVIKRNL